MPRLWQSEASYRHQGHSRSQLIADRWHRLGGVLDKPPVHPISSKFTGCVDGALGQRLRGDSHLSCRRVRDSTR